MKLWLCVFMCVYVAIFVVLHTLSTSFFRSHGHNLCLVLVKIARNSVEMGVAQENSLNSYNNYHLLPLVDVQYIALHLLFLLKQHSQATFFKLLGEAWLKFRRKKNTRKKYNFSFLTTSSISHLSGELPNYMRICI